MPEWDWSHRSDLKRGTRTLIERLPGRSVPWGTTPTFPAWAGLVGGRVATGKGDYAGEGRGYGMILKGGPGLPSSVSPSWARGSVGGLVGLPFSPSRADGRRDPPLISLAMPSRPACYLARFRKRRTAGGPTIAVGPWSRVRGAYLLKGPHPRGSGPVRPGVPGPAGVHGGVAAWSVTLRWRPARCFGLVPFPSLGSGLVVRGVPSS